jgi:hypothetical protein
VKTGELSGRREMASMPVVPRNFWGRRREEEEWLIADKPDNEYRYLLYMDKRHEKWSAAQTSKSSPGIL